MDNNTTTDWSDHPVAVVRYRNRNGKPCLKRFRHRLAALNFAGNIEAKGYRAIKVEGI